MERRAAIDEAIERVRILSLDQADLDFDFISSQLAGLKAAIDDIVLASPGETWTFDWLTKEHKKGGMLYVGALMNYRKELSDGRKPPFEPTYRAALIGRFNKWAKTAQIRLYDFRDGERSAATVNPWIRKLDDFERDPMNNE